MAEFLRKHNYECAKKFYEGEMKRAPVRPPKNPYPVEEWPDETQALPAPKAAKGLSEAPMANERLGVRRSGNRFAGSLMS